MLYRALTIGLFALVALGQTIPATAAAQGVGVSHVAPVSVTTPVASVAGPATKVPPSQIRPEHVIGVKGTVKPLSALPAHCLLYTSDAADE